MNDDASLENFSGIARLFPLPNLVMFPSVVQPLHIFEPRYREMMVDALADDRLLAMVLLKPGWEEDYHKRPLIHSIACIGEIQQEKRLAEGRWNLLLHGLRRIRIIEELPPDKLYRLGRVQLLEEFPCDLAEEKQLRGGLEQRMLAYLAAHGGAVDQARLMLQSDLSLGLLCDIFSYALPVDLEIKQELLEELVIRERAKRLFGLIDGLIKPSGPSRPFPPPFSAN